MFQKCAVRSILCVLLLNFPAFAKVLQFENISGAETGKLTEVKYLRLKEYKRLIQHDVATNEVIDKSPLPSKPRTKYEDNDDDNGGPSSEFRPKGHHWALENRKHNDTPDSHTVLLRNSSDISLSEINQFYTHLPNVMRTLEKSLEKTLQKAKLKGIVTGKY